MSKTMKALGLALALTLGGFALAHTPAEADGPNCCQQLFNHCVQVICRDKGGVAEFNCNADTCQASCLCNIFP
jgi:Spy/CpxP family protein refolding chaperone